MNQVDEFNRSYGNLKKLEIKQGIVSTLVHMNDMHKIQHSECVRRRLGNMSRGEWKNASDVH